MKSKAEISKASMIMEPLSNGLRDIIIDVSNVAMWWVWRNTYFLLTTVRVVLVYKHNFELRLSYFRIILIKIKAFSLSDVRRYSSK